MALAGASPDSLHFMPMHVPLNIDPHLSPINNNNTHLRVPISPADGGLGWMLDMESTEPSQPFNFYQIQQQQQQQRFQPIHQQQQHPMGIILGTHHQLDDSHFSKDTYLQQHQHAHFSQPHYPNPPAASLQYRSSFQSPATVAQFADFSDMHHHHHIHTSSSCPTIFPTTNSTSPIPIPIHTNTTTIVKDATTTPPATTVHSNSGSPEFRDDNDIDDDDEQVCSSSPRAFPVVDHDSIFARYLTVMNDSKAGNNNNNSNNNATAAPSFTTTNTTSTTATATHTHSGNPKSKPYLRRPIQKDQKHVLKRMFKQDPSPLPAQVRWIAAELGLEKNKVKVWFQNQRAQLKRRQNVIALRPNKAG
ncbi:hypothetical protein HDU77_005415 [Chytriomyces hyalinus]|nr:hypothetical protein HDU77_005415 [Chytriomyces hyalinus]